MTDQELLYYTTELAKAAAESQPEEYAKNFTTELTNHKDIMAEYTAYLNTGKLTCKYDVSGYTIADIVIWQMDHFKALLDDKQAQNKENPYRMILEAFATMMKMENNPEKYVSTMQATTGTDYIQKY